MDHLFMGGSIFAGVMLVIALVTMLSSFFTVDTAEAAIVTRFGEFLRIAHPGLSWKIPYVDKVAEKLSLRLNQIDLKIEVKTKDNVFVELPIAIQTRVLSGDDNIYKAYYELGNPKAQINSYVDQVVRNQAATLNLDEMFTNQATIAHAVKADLENALAQFGYEIADVRVRAIEPPESVKIAMNNINAAQRDQVASEARGEAEKIFVIKRAEAAAEDKRLQGVGTANQRKAIVEGLYGSFNAMKDSMTGLTRQEAMHLVMLTQYMDTMKSIGASGKSNTLFLDGSPGGLTSFSEQMQALMATHPQPQQQPLSQEQPHAPQGPA